MGLMREKEFKIMQELEVEKLKEKVYVGKGGEKEEI